MTAKLNILPYELTRLRDLPARLRANYSTLAEHDSRERNYRDRLTLGKTEQSEAVLDLNIDDDAAVARWGLKAARMAAMESWLTGYGRIRAGLLRSIEGDLCWLKAIVQNNGRNAASFGEWHQMDLRVSAAADAVHKLLADQGSLV